MGGRAVVRRNSSPWVTSTGPAGRACTLLFATCSVRYTFGSTDGTHTYSGVRPTLHAITGTVIHFPVEGTSTGAAQS